MARGRRQKILLGEFGRAEPPAPPIAAVTFTDYATTWVAAREIKPKTREGYEHVLNKYLVPRFTSRPIADITPADVRTWWASMNPDTPTVRARSGSVRAWARASFHAARRTSSKASVAQRTM